MQVGMISNSPVFTDPVRFSGTLRLIGQKQTGKQHRCMSEGLLPVSVL